jgi:hypothetical protein
MGHRGPVLTPELPIENDRLREGQYEVDAQL